MGEVVDLSADRDPALATSAEKRAITLATAPRNREAVIEVVDLSVDPNPALATSADKRGITLATAPTRRDQVVRDKSSATTAKRWVTCPVTVLREDRSPEEVVATASTATNPDTWPETVLKETPTVAAAVEVAVDVEIDLPVPVTDAVKKVTSSLTALSPTPKARRRTKRSHLSISHNS